MRIEEFRRSARRHVSLAWIAVLGLGLGVPLVPTVLLCSFWLSISEWLRSFFSPGTAALLPAVMMVPIGLAAFAAIRVMRRIDRRYGIPCPHCGRFLAHGSPVVIASKNCPFCGGRVLSVEPPAVDGVQHIAPSEFAMAVKSYERRSILALAIFMAFILAGLGTVFVAGFVCREFLPGLSQTAKGRVCGATGMGGLVGGFLSLFLLDRHSRKSARLRCPHCNSFLGQSVQFVGIVIASRHCPRCGQQVLCEGPPPQEPRGGVTAPELREALMRYQPDLVRRAAVAAGLFYGGALLWAVSEALRIKQLGWVGLLISVGGVPYVVFIERRLTRAGRPRCPHCGELLRQAGIVIASRNCPKCGQNVILDRPEQESPSDAQRP